MLNVGPGELLAICVVALIVLGPDKLPQALRTVGRVTSELRRMSSGFQNELRSAMSVDETLEAQRRSMTQPSGADRPGRHDDPRGPQGDGPGTGGAGDPADGDSGSSTAGDGGGGSGTGSAGATASRADSGDAAAPPTSGVEPSDGQRATP